jgi:hypothetical protein
VLQSSSSSGSSASRPADNSANRLFRYPYIPDFPLYLRNSDNQHQVIDGPFRDLLGLTGSRIMSSPLGMGNQDDGLALAKRPPAEAAHPERSNEKAEREAD